MLIWFEVFGSKIKKTKTNYICDSYQFCFRSKWSRCNRCIVIESIRTKDRIFSYHGSIVQKSRARVHLTVLELSDCLGRSWKSRLKNTLAVCHCKISITLTFCRHPFIVKCVKDVHTCFMYLSSKSLYTKTHCLWIKEDISNYA